LIIIALFYQYWFFINRLRSYFIPFIAVYTECYVITHRINTYFQNNWQY
jgi:hypothetical protein